MSRQSSIHANKSYLASRIDNLRRICLSLENNFVTKGVLDGWVVAFDEVAFTVLNSQG